LAEIIENNVYKEPSPRATEVINAPGVEFYLVIAIGRNAELICISRPARRAELSVSIAGA